MILMPLGGQQSLLMLGKLYRRACGWIMVEAGSHKYLQLDDVQLLML